MEHVAGFFAESADTKYGGFLEDWRDGRFYDRGEKYLVLQARHIWTFDMLSNEPGDRWAQLADQGIAFLNEHFLDEAHGGYYSSCSSSGEPVDTRKYLYLQSFALFALSRHALRTRRSEDLALAFKQFRTLEKRARDRWHGGYEELFASDWTPLTDKAKHRHGLATGRRSMNAHIHLFEAYSELYLASEDRRVGARVDALGKLIMSRFRRKEYAQFIDVLDQRWRPLKDGPAPLASYGHDLETAWLLMTAAEARNKLDQKLYAQLEEIAKTNLRLGEDPIAGGVSAGGPFGAPSTDPKRIWWVQAEALVAFLMFFRRSNDKKWWDAFLRTLNVIRSDFCAPDGGIYAEVGPDGAIIDPARASCWQGGYHMARALMFCADNLKEMSLQNSTGIHSGGDPALP